MLRILEHALAFYHENAHASFAWIFVHAAMRQSPPLLGMAKKYLSADQYRRGIDLCVTALLHHQEKYPYFG